MKKITKIIILLISLILVASTLIYFLLFNDINKSNEETTTSTQTTTTQKIQTKSVAKLTFVGDYLYEKPYMNAIDRGEDKAMLLSKVKKYFQEDDLSIGNMETNISDGSIPVGDYYYTFSAPSYIGNEIASVGMDVLGTSNNHTNDYGYAGIKSTINFYRNNTNILTVGTNILDDINYDRQIIEKNGIKFGFVGYSNTLNKKDLTGYREAINYSKDYTKIREDLKKEIDYLKDKVDVIIAIVHWGVEFNFTPHESEVKMAKIMNELGVDIIMGSHAHSIQPIEWIDGENKKTLVMYGMGNFVSCDTKLSRTTDTYRRAYQYGILANLNVVKENNEIRIEEIHTTPIISYFNKSKKNFVLIPYNEYTEEYETTHYMYSQGFTKEFIKSTYESVIKEEFR